jgi:hypothetical protein
MTTKNNLFVGAILPLFLFLLVIGFSSAYEIVHYESFQYDATPAQLVADHGFTSISSGINSCLATSGAESYLGCSGTASINFNQHLNLLSSSNCVSANGTTSGGAVNYSMRIRAKLSSNGGFMYNDLLRFTSGNNGSAIGFNGYYPIYNYYSNLSGGTKFYGSSLTNAGNNIWYFIPPKDEWFVMQIDFLGENNAGDYKGTFARYTLFYAGNNYTLNYPEAVPFSISCINFTNFNFQLISGAPSFSGYIDYVYVMKYGAGESPVDIRTNMTDYYTTGMNQMPEAQIYTENKAGTQTSNVYPTTSCIPHPIPFSTETDNSGCNPLYIRYNTLFDPENNTISEGLFCGYSGGDNISTATDSFSGVLGTTYQDRYNVSCAQNTAYYFNGQLYEGMLLPSALGCPGSWKSHFNNDYPSDYSYISNLADSMMQFDFRPLQNKKFNIEFFNSNGNTPIVLSFIYNTSSRMMEIYSGTDIMNLPLSYVTDSVNADSPVRLFMAFNNEGNLYSFRLQQFNSTTENNFYFYSSGIAFDWSLPLSIMKLTATTADGFTPVNDSEYIGNYDVRNIIFPAFTQVNTNETKHLNCTSANAGERIGYLFLTDSVHQNNYLNYIPFIWSVSVLGEDNTFQGEDPNSVISQGFFEMFAGSTTLTYIFVFLIFVVVVIGCLVAGASIGSASAGFYLGGFAGFTWLMIAFLLGLLPIWIIIAIFIMLAAIVAFATSKMFGASGGG